MYLSNTRNRLQIPRQTPFLHVQAQEEPDQSFQSNLKVLSHRRNTKNFLPFFDKKYKMKQKETLQSCASEKYFQRYQKAKQRIFKQHQMFMKYWEEKNERINIEKVRSINNKSEMRLSNTKSSTQLSYEMPWSKKSEFGDTDTLQQQSMISEQSSPFKARYKNFKEYLKYMQEQEKNFLHA